MPEIVDIIQSEEAGKGVRTLRFEYHHKVEPGQFFMVWLPGVDEVPMSASYCGGRKGITVKEIGPATKALCNLRSGDKIGVRGPYGHGYTLHDGRALVVGGGTGMASLLPAVEAIGDPSRVDVAIGARNVSELLFIERARAASNNVRTSTDDGTNGLKGTAVDLVSDMLSKERYDFVLACGPEKMLFYLLVLLEKHNVKCELSLERYMKCGAGLCGSCALDDKRVCVDGPVFTGEQARRMTEFGKFRRNEAGQLIKL
ncbi:MAG: dihydroorotate dehydrogenase electron transfer subunit [Methanomassiliicoccales archaeon]|jgi:dihydroorotate dehydrogenase electron transfer subunit